MRKVDPDPRIHLSVIMDPDPHLEKGDPDPVQKWIRIRVPIFHIFHKEIHVGQITMLICYRQNLEKAFLR